MKGNLADVLKIYFSRIFPFDDLFKWLYYGEDKTFSCRELALNFEGERYLRNQAFSCIDALKHVILKYKPVKIDIGAVYNTSPLNRARTPTFYPVQRELAFDIDMTDYDEVRTCCSGVNICQKCWKFMTLAVQILDIALKEDFGFNHVLWVFSGRRGIHGWVCDERARFLRHDGRYAVANYLQLVTGGEYKKKKVEIKDKMHPSVKRALQIIEPLFAKICVEEQNMLGTDERVSKFLGIIDEEMRDEIKEMLYQYPTSLTRWEAFVIFYKNQCQLKSEKWCKTPFLIEEIMIQYAYPRLDIHVTLGMNHLLKAPFCIHPSTGKIGVPIDVKDIEEFDPFTIPNVTELMEEIDKFDAKSMQQGMSIQELRNIKDITKTSLNKYLHIFQDFISSLQESNGEEIYASEAEMSF